VARPRSRVRPLETPGNWRPREMTAASSAGDRLGEQNPAYRPSLALFSFQLAGLLGISRRLGHGGDLIRQPEQPESVFRA
jgi:hypothetical protein